jgi:hypothetical protein
MQLPLAEIQRVLDDGSALAAVCREGGVGTSKNGKNGAKTCQAFILFFSGTLCC